MGSGACFGDSQETRWFEAARNGNRDRLITILKPDWDINTQDALAWTALKWTAKNGHADCLDYLVRNKADVDSGGSTGSTHSATTPLMLAALEGHYKCLMVLSKAGSNLNARDKHGRTAAMIAAQMGHLSCLSCLVTYKADISIKDEDGQSVAMAYLLSTGTLLPREFSKAPADAVAALLGSTSRRVSVEKAMTVDAASEVTIVEPWFAALATGDLRLVESFTKQAAFPIDAKNPERLSGAMLAIERGMEELLKFLLGAQADPRQRGKGSRTLLMAAAKDGKKGCVQLLLDFRADAGAKDDAGRNALMLACTSGHVDCMRALLQEQSPQALVDAKDKGGRSSVATAAMYGRESCLQLLIETQGNLDSLDQQGQTPAILAAAGGFRTCVQRIAKSGGGMLHRRRVDGRTALQIIEMNHGEREARELLSKANWELLSRKSLEKLITALAETFPRGAADEMCAASLQFELWQVAEAPDATAASTAALEENVTRLKTPRNVNLAERLASHVAELLGLCPNMTISPQQKELTQMLLRAGVLEAASKNAPTVIRLASSVLEELQGMLQQRQTSSLEKPLSELTSVPNEYYLPEGYTRVRGGAPVLDQRDAMPDDMWKWLEELPSACTAALQEAYRAFKNTGAVPTTLAFRDMLVASELTMDHVLNATASAHLCTSYAKVVDEAFGLFMKGHFGSRLSMAPTKKIQRILAKKREDIPELFDEKAAACDPELRCGYMQISDVVRCSLEAEGGEDMIKVVKELRQLHTMSDLGQLEVLRIKNSHHRAFPEQEILGGYRDVKVLGRFTAKAPMPNGLPISMIVEIQVVDAFFLKVKKYMHMSYTVIRGDFTRAQTTSLA
eukprot:TRINITY_DN24277_c0_g1_i1.p1 TRINITY_DN24277_c0_g1~~TRINITY_DN24277_c0_g1_i1.p1  ORF type:complete len:849 (+),score=233.62 TRINITY_DN24277_c0_g1_i1:219-2765(+)